MEKLRYFTRQHSGGLKESLVTTKEISRDKFIANLNQYDYYGFDERVNQVLYLLKNMNRIEGMIQNKPLWMFIGTKRDIETYLNTHT